MNEADRILIAELTKSLRDLTEQVQGLAYLADPEAKSAIDELVRIAPTLGELAKGYDRAGWLAGGVGLVVKWIGIVAGAIAGVWGVLALHLGDKP